MSSSFSHQPFEACKRALFFFFCDGTGLSPAKEQTQKWDVQHCLLMFCRFLDFDFTTTPFHSPANLLSVFLLHEQLTHRMREQLISEFDQFMVRDMFLWLIMIVVHPAAARAESFASFLFLPSVMSHQTIGLLSAIKDKKTAAEVGHSTHTQCN